MNCVLLCLLLALAELVSGRDTLHIVFSGVSANGERLRPLALHVTQTGRLEIRLESEPRAPSDDDEAGSTG
jgi:hypothetical protein